MKRFLKKLLKYLLPLFPSPSKPSTPAAPPPELSFTIGAGPVNHVLDPDFPRKQLCQDLVDAGVGICYVAFYGWAASFLNNSMSYRYVEKQLRELIQLCSSHSLLLFIDFTNDNQGLGKYGDKMKPLTSYLPEIKEAALWLKDTLDKHPDLDYWLQPVGEAGMNTSNTPHPVETICTSIFPRYKLVSNGSKGRPSGPASWADLFAWHPANLSATPPAGAVVVSDHSGILAQIYGPSWATGAPANPELVEDWARNMLGLGARAVILYDFGGTKPDVPAYQALRKGATNP